jgi:hypothetical protein
MIPRVTLRKALTDPNLLGDVLAGGTWFSWRTLLIAAMGEQLTDNERVLFRQLAGGREREPGRQVEECAFVVGRRGGKSRAISVLVSYIGGLCRHPALAPGERGILLCIAPDQKQADIVLDYVEANFRSSPILRQLIEARIARELRLTNGVDIEVRASDFRRLRGPTYVGCVADECAFWLAENSSNPDSEILASVRPGLATTGGPLFMISSPYARRGELWNIYNKHFAVVDRAMERDPASAAAEYGAEFRRDIEAFVSIEAVRNCIFSPGVLERPRQSGVAHRAFIDPSGGSSDSMTLCIGHYQIGKQTAVVDLIREIRPPFSPEQVCSEFAATLRSYNLSSVEGDRFGGAWVTEQFAKFGVRYTPAEKPKSELYRDLLACINSGRIDLLDHPRLISQLVGLERRSSRGTGRDVIDHAPGGHDDIANAVAGIASSFITKRVFNFNAFCGGDDDDDPDGARAWRAMRFAEHIRLYG